MLGVVFKLTLVNILAVAVLSIPQITRKGRWLYQEEVGGGSTRFFIKGIAYQPQGELHESDDNHFGEPGTFIDPLADAEECRRDLPILRAASINTLRVYSVNSSLNHDECMQAFSNANIYIILDLSLPIVGSIDRTFPSWSTNIMDVYLATIDAFEKYDNVIAYNVGNEVVDNNSTTFGAAPFLKAAARDIKAYLKSLDSQRLVGYAAIDGNLTVRKDLADFLSCGSEETAIDIYGLNEYTWCGSGSSFESSGYNEDVAQFADYNVVTYFSEFGCVKAGPRTWTEVGSLFGENMTSVWSGGIAFSYFPAESNEGKFGMVAISTNGTSAEVSSELRALGERYRAVNSTNNPSKDAAMASNYPTFSSSSPFSSALPGTPNHAGCNCLEVGLTCVVSPVAANNLDIVGPLIGVACGLLGENGGSCTEIGSNGLDGSYGRVSGCAPRVKLSYAMSDYYERQNRRSAACDFNRNASLNPHASWAESLSDLAVSCLPSPHATGLPRAFATPRTSRDASRGPSVNGTLDSLNSSSLPYLVCMLSLSLTLVMASSVL
ncbi:1,3-beta-glucanosyltransferase [Coprinopsis marcescibilis]|uniref:1,3-beta-glucanosyltransferase n=1 Tax=Coprinopsis marcescibilis TaxID=230819 RepID=A0A5C3KM88_COPMA|nr:1,3-beta-glucanosyltransferase [Coprinopsis marcescibilis]